MKNIIHFTPKEELELEENLKSFISICRKSSVWNVKENFENNVWDVGFQKGQNKTIRLIFSTAEAASKNSSGPYLQQPFLDFAKSVIVYLQETDKVVNPSARISALRHLEQALRELSKDSRPTAVSEMVLNKAIEILRNNNSDGFAYSVGGQLEKIAHLMQEKGFINISRKWSHGIGRPKDNRTRTSEDAAKRREEKMPSEAALRALGGIFYEAVKPSDVYVSSVMAIMCCAPERINEVLRLRRNCFIEGDGRFNGILGLRWQGSKGFSETVKWLPTSMAPIAKEAVENLKKITDPAKSIANWYVENPDKIYYHEDVSHLRNRETISAEEIARILWGEEGTRQAANLWIKNKELKNIGSSRLGAYSRELFEKILIQMLPKKFPYIPGDEKLICTESLVVIRKNEFHQQRATYQCMIEYADYGTIDNRLGVAGKESIFDSLGYTEDDGSKIEMNTHSLRHYLNTLAQMGGLSSAEIAIFSGRKDINQNRYYDHMTSDEVQAPINEAIKNGKLISIDITSSGNRNLINRDDFKNLGRINAHTTTYGYCIHNFASEPCQMYRDCINCQEQVCIKGEKYKEANIRKLKDETENLLANAREALSKEEYGADRWVIHQEKTLERIINILQVIDNPSVIPGAVIHFKSPPVLLVEKKSIAMRKVRKALK